MRYLLNSKARNFILYILIEVEYENVHNGKSSKEMCDFLALPYEVYPDSGDHMLQLLDLKNLSMVELLGILKFHEIKLRKDEGQQKGNFIVLKDHHPKPSKLNNILMKFLKKKVLIKMRPPLYP
ncbi:hypothetical protein CR513_43265, partial [Mucuna pruriens]